MTQPLFADSQGQTRLLGSSRFPDVMTAFGIGPGGLQHVIHSRHHEIGDRDCELIHVFHPGSTIKATIKGLEYFQLYVVRASRRKPCRSKFGGVLEGMKVLVQPHCLDRSRGQLPWGAFPDLHIGFHFSLPLGR